MNDLNCLVIEGRLCKDPQVMQSKNGKSILKLTIANNKYRFTQNGTENEVSYFDVVGFGKLAEYAKNITKGTGCRIIGKLKQDRWMQENGQQRSTIQILAESIEYRKQKEKVNDTANNSDVPGWEDL